jgi:hypothetical protein
VSDVLSTYLEMLFSANELSNDLPWMMSTVSLKTMTTVQLHVHCKHLRTS